MTELIRHEPVALETALDMDAMAQAGYTYVWYQEQSRAGICDVRDYQPDPQRLLEARIFTCAGEHEEASEVHVFYGQDGALKAVRTVISGEADYTEERQLLLPEFGESLTVRTVYAYDADGQATPAAFLLTGYERGRL